MDQIRTSYSALDTFKQCPLRYKYQQIDRIRTPKNKDAVFGNKIHTALEYFHSKTPCSPTLDELLNKLKEIWDSEVFQNEQEDILYFSEAIKILKNYHSSFSQIKEKPAILGTETRFEILLEKNDKKATLSGIIDRIDKTSQGIEIVDYKTAKRLPSQQDIDNSLQLSLYCLGLMKRWPEFKLKDISLSFYFLKHQEKLTTTRTKEQLDLVKEKVFDDLEKIEKSNFKPTPTPLCDWCGYKKMCPMWRHLYKKELTVDDEQIKKIANEYFELKQENSKNNKRLNELKIIIENYLNKEKIERVFTDQVYITRSYLTKYEYDFDKLKEILEPLNKWNNILTINITKLKNIIKALPYPKRKEIEKIKKKSKEYSMLNIKKKRN
ncbi:PD-(D/E)XK nuclease family protein [Patescibacteria group bacterium]|nr:PD-(D/E)XK nuclease family protein [Patescibacteria group bacterium]